MALLPMDNGTPLVCAVALVVACLLLLRYWETPNWSPYVLLFSMCALVLGTIALLWDWKTAVYVAAVVLFRR